MLRFIVLCAFLVLVRGQTTTVSECINSQAPLPINALVKDCITPPCLLPQLQYLVIDIVFRAPRVLRTLTTRAMATVNLGIVFDIVYELGDLATTCNFLTNTYCPLMPEEVVQYRFTMYIESFFPANTGATVEVRVEDEEDVPLWCVRLPMRVVPPVAALTSVNGTEYLDPHQN